MSLPAHAPYEAFRAAVEDPGARRALLFDGGRPRFVLHAQQFERADLDRLCLAATAIRRLDRHRDGVAFLRSILAGRRILNLFAQPSTRTNESFVAAGEKLGATVRVVADLRTSSFAKGETVEDSVRTLSSFYDLLVTRHPDDDFATRASWAVWRSRRPIPVVSAGSGRAEHPTQALLDVYTLRHAFRDRLDGRRILVVSDIGRNRAARSLVLLLTQYALRRLDVVCVPGHGPDPALREALAAAGVALVEHRAVGPALDAIGGDLDAIYMTRLQQEWDEGKDALGTADDFVLHPRFRDRLRPECVVLHPLPRVNELPEEWDEHPGTMIWRQVRNGMWVRAALLAAIHGADAEILGRAGRLGLV